MLFYALLKFCPEAGEMYDEARERRLERLRKSGKVYDPETSPYKDELEHDLCQMRLRMSR